MISDHTLCQMNFAGWTEIPENKKIKYNKGPKILYTKVSDKWHMPTVQIQIRLSI